jgi:hypothetical protein
MAGGGEACLFLRTAQVQITAVLLVAAMMVLVVGVVLLFPKDPTLHNLGMLSRPTSCPMIGPTSRGAACSVEAMHQ